MGIVFKNEKEFRETLKKNNVLSSSSRSRSKNNSVDAAYKSAVQTLWDLKDSDCPILFGGAVKLSLAVVGATKADMDNIYKAAADSLQGLAYSNDSAVTAGEFGLYSSTGRGCNGITEKKK